MIRFCLRLKAISLLVAAFVSVPVFGKTNLARNLPAGLQEELVQLYTQGNCAEILRKSSPSIVKLLRPNVMAIVASCDPHWEGLSSEEIFKLAQDEVPTGDLILVLHAKYRTHKDPASAVELWRKVLLIARNDAFIEMANAYFSGNYEGLNHPINLSPITLFGNFQVGAGYESNARPKDFAYLKSRTSGTGLVLGDLTWRDWRPWGSFAVNLNFSGHQFFSDPSFNSQQADLHIPFALHVAPSKDLVFQPITGYQRIGGEPYRDYFGLGVLGVVYRNGYKQSVQGLVYQEHVSANQLTNTGGAHYRFEYSWEFFSELQYFSMLLGVEHVSSDHSFSFNSVDGYFPWSHTNIDAEFKYERNFRAFTLGVAPTFLFRIDSEQSIFPNQVTLQTVAVRRSDWILGVKPYIEIKLMPAVQLMAWYSYERVLSNIGITDYANYNQTDHVVALALKVAVSTY